MPRGYSDLYNLFDFLWPETSLFDQKIKISLYDYENSGKTEEAKVLIDNRIGGLFYRVRKKDLNLSEPVFYPPTIVPMKPLERKIYEALKAGIKDYPIDEYLLNIDTVTRLKRGRLMRLRQCISYLPLLNSSIEGYDEDLLRNNKDLRYIIRDYQNLEIPGKFEALRLLLKEILNRGEKVVIWSNFIFTIERLSFYLRGEFEVENRVIYGATPIEKNNEDDKLTRDEIIEQFLNPNSNVSILIANPAACAESISLHKTCRNAIYFDLSYNCAQYLQSLDRIHRVGGSEFALSKYYYLQYSDTIDNDIYENLLRKADKMSRIIDEDYRIVSLDMADATEDDDINAYDRIFQ
jgi:SNF2 family DNA or RNA helicase